MLCLLLQWKGLPYAECTFETPEVIAQAGGQEALDQYEVTVCAVLCCAVLCCAVLCQPGLFLFISLTRLWKVAALALLVHAPRSIEANSCKQGVTSL